MEILTNSQKRDTITGNADNSANSFQVTDIKQAVKNPNRANIFIDGKYSFSLDITQLVDAKLKIGAMLTAERLDELKHASAFGKLYQRTLEWVLARPRSIKETHDYLTRASREKNQKVPFRRKLQLPERGAESFSEGVRLGLAPRSAPEEKSFSSFIDESVVKTTTREAIYDEKDFLILIERLINKGYLDDRKFAEYYVENRFVKKGISTKRLKMELKKKGVSSQIIDEVLSQNTRTDEQEIQKIIAKKRAKYDDIKLIQYLARQGFDFELARNLVRESSETDSQN